MVTAHVALLIGLALSTASAAVARMPAEHQFVIVPLRVHILATPDLDMANCRSPDADFARVIGDVNAIWHRAGVHFGVEAMLREPADQKERFRLIVEQNQGRFGPAHLQLLLPRASRDFDGLHAYFFHAMPANSSFLGDDIVIAQEGAMVNPVPGGGDNPVARVTAHALGRALALSNEEDPRNLMAGGTSGVALDGRQAERARKMARTIRGAATLPEVSKAAEAAEARGDAPEGRRLRSWLTEVSGAVEAEAKRLAALPPAGPGPSYDQFLIVPLRVHALTTPDLPLADCKLSDADLARVIGDVNAIWHRAGVHFGVEAMLREPADQRERFRLATEANPGEFACPERMLLPRATRNFEGLHAYYFHEILSLNGAYLGGDSVIVQEGPRLDPVERGGDDPVARVTAHALGSALGLPDDPDPTNLMANGTSGVELGAEQAEVAHRVARTVRGVATVAEVRKAALAAEANREVAAARRLWSWLAGLPGGGPGAAEAKRRRDRLDQALSP